MAKVLVLNPRKGFHIAECDDIDDFYKELECDIFDIASRKIGGTYFDIFVDDIGLFHNDPVVSAVDSKGNPMLVGNLIFANHDSEGNTTSLSNKDMFQILEKAVMVVKDEKTFLAVVCEY